MRTLWQKLQQRLRLLARTEDGIAAVEFALVLPIMLLVYIGSVEASAAISMDRRVQQVTGALGDLVARADTRIPAATLLDYFQAAEGIMTPYQVSQLRQVVTQVEVRNDGTAWVVWSRQYENGNMIVGTDHAAAAAFTMPTAMTNIAKGKFVIVAEATYTYTPPYGFAFDHPIDLYRENFFVPRFGGSITIN